MPTIITPPPGTFWQAYQRDEDGDVIRKPVFALSVPAVLQLAESETWALSGEGQWLPVRPWTAGAELGIAGKLGYYFPGAIP